MAESTEKIRSHRLEDLRIISAIAGKDILDAIKNKTTLTIIISVFIMALFSQALPLLLKLQDTHRVVVYDATESNWTADLSSGDGLEVYRVPSMAELESVIAESSGVILGLAIPSGFKEQIPASGKLLLDGYIAHWADISKVEETRSTLETRLASIAGGPVGINTRDHLIYPQLDADGQPSMITLTLVTVIIMITTIVVPQLLVEEKENHTMDVILVSPATAWHIVTGKALAGFFYGLTAATVIMLINQAMFNHWAVAIATTFAGVLFATALGLLLGTFVNNQQAIGLWTGLLFILLLIPLLLVNLMGAGWSLVLQEALSWTPSIALGELYRISFSADVRFNLVFKNLAVLLISTLLLLAIVVWQTKRSDR